jgi:hypothetical protein
MFQINAFTRLGSVDGLGDEEIPWYIAPYVRDFAALAKSGAVLEANRALAAAPAPQLALTALAGRLAQTAAIARVAAHVEGGKALAAGVSGSIRDEIDEYCGTPPRPHHIGQAALAVALLASSLDDKDPAKTALVGEAERLQQKLATSR